MRKVRNRLVMIVLMLAIFGFLHIRPCNVGAAGPEGVYREAIHYGISSDFLDPGTGGYSISGSLMLYLFHDALFKPMPPMPGGLYTPCLAESWVISPDARSYEFKLREGVKFHNGDTMTAEDVVFSLKRYRASQAKFIESRIAKIEALNPHLVRIDFKVPFPDFLEYLLPGVSSLGWIVPKKYVEKVGDAGYKKHPIGCGPYKFVEFNPGVRIVGEAFQEYWRKVPNIKRMEFILIPDPATRLAMVRRGEVDSVTYMADAFNTAVKEDPKLRLIAPMSPSQYMLYISAQWDPKSPWSDQRVRKAASLAIDRKTLADIYLPGCGPIGAFGLKPDPLTVQFPPDPYDPQGAKKLLADAGYPNGFHGGKYWPYDGALWPLGEQVANYWKAIGINVDIVLLERPAHVATRAGGKMGGGLYTETVAAPTISGRLAYLLGSNFYGSYPDIQALWDQYGQAVEAHKRKDLIVRIQELIREKAMWIPLTSVNHPCGVGPRVKGNPYKLEPYLYLPVPYENMELVK
jgi:peptide/nickel transport system substrate-binding protein